MRDGTAPDGLGSALHRRPPLARKGCRRPHRPRPGPDPRRPPARRTGVDPVRGGKPDDGEPAQADPVFPYPGSRRGRGGAQGGQGAVDQGCGHEPPCFVALRRKPAEGGDRQGAPHRAESPPDGRAEPRDRHRRKVRRVPHHAKAGRAGDRDCVRDVRPRRGSGSLRPYRRDEPWPRHRAPRARRRHRSRDRGRFVGRARSGPSTQQKDMLQ